MNSRYDTRHLAGIALVAFLMLHGAQNAVATGSYYYADPNDGSEDILEKYPGWPDTNRCAACHKWQSPSSANFNPFGLAFKNNKNLSAIAGIDSDGDGVPNGNELQAKLLPGLKTAAPTGLAASDDAFTDKVQVTWNPVPTPSGWHPSSLAQTSSYKVYRATSQGGSKTPLPGTVSAPSYNDSAAHPGTTYYYWVKATSPGGQSAFSSPDSGRRKSTITITLSKAGKKEQLQTTNVQPPSAAIAAQLGKVMFKLPPPPPPSGVKASDGTFLDKVRVTWNAVPDASSYNLLSYRVYRTQSPGANKQLIGSTSGITRDDIGAMPGTTYYYWVDACNTVPGDVAKGIPSQATCSGYGGPDSGFKKHLVIAPAMGKVLQKQEQQKSDQRQPVVRASPVVKRTSPEIKTVPLGIKPTSPALNVAPLSTTRPSTEREEAPASAERASPTIKVVPRN